MSTLYLHIDDVGLEAQCGDAAAVTSPGYAIVEKDGFSVGAEACAQARSKPRQTNSRFWDALSLEPFAQPGRGARHNADLAYAQLEQIWAAAHGAEAALIAVPGSFSRDQLALLLGICQRLAIPVRGLIDAAVAACALHAHGQACLHLDLKLHRLVATDIDARQRCTRGKVSELDTFGLVDLQERWVEAISDVFVRVTRFDPLYNADSEQELYDRLPQWLAQLQDGPGATLTLGAAESSYDVAFERAAAVKAVAAHYRELTEHLDAEHAGKQDLYLARRDAALPGLSDALAASGRHVHVLPAGATLSGLQRLREQLLSPADAIALITAVDPEAAMSQRPRLKAVSASRRETGAAAAPTHLLFDAQAFLLDDRPLVVGSQPAAQDRSLTLNGGYKGVSRRHCSVRCDGPAVVLDDHSTYGTYVNGRRIEGSTTLNAGDRVQVGNPGVELILIRQVSD